MIPDFGLKIVPIFQKLEGEYFTWHVSLMRKHLVVFNGEYRAGLAHCKRSKLVAFQGYRKDLVKITREIAQVFKPHGTLAISDCEGYVEPTPPDLHSYLHIIQDDARSGEHLLFEDFADEFCMSRDSRAAEAIWRACQETRGRLMKVFGKDFDTFMNTDFDQ